MTLTKFVYSTNYDLLAYWALMHESGPRKSKDMFWDAVFNLSNTEVWGKSTVILYLHGGLHLYRTSDGRTLKRQAQNGANLLDLFGVPLASFPDSTPLFVSEGTASDKLRSIYRSDYLAFAYLQLMRHEGPLCVFGSALGDSDQHLIDAIKNAKVRDIAFSIRPNNSTKVIAAKGSAIEKMPWATLHFFDSTTHPLGNPNLQIA